MSSPWPDGQKCRSGSEYDTPALSTRDGSALGASTMTSRPDPRPGGSLHSSARFRTTSSVHSKALVALLPTYTFSPFFSAGDSPRLRVTVITSPPARLHPTAIVNPPAHACTFALPEVWQPTTRWMSSASVGLEVGAPVGAVGLREGRRVGVGAPVGCDADVGARVGRDGRAVGAGDGLAVGARDGDDGDRVGAIDGLAVGEPEGARDGDAVGSALVGARVADVGCADGAPVGTALGANVQGFSRPASALTDPAPHGIGAVDPGGQ